MQVSVIDGNIISFQFDNLKEQGMSFFRLSEFYESAFDSLRENLFSFEQFLECYTEPNGKMNYFYDWTAYNIPGYSVNNFFETFLLLTEKEAILKHYIDTLIDKSKDYYVISSITSISDFSNAICK